MAQIHQKDIFRYIRNIIPNEWTFWTLAQTHRLDETSIFRKTTRWITVYTRFIGNICGIRIKVGLYELRMYRCSLSGTGNHLNLVETAVHMTIFFGFNEFQLFEFDCLDFTENKSYFEYSFSLYISFKYITILEPEQYSAVLWEQRHELTYRRNNWQRSC